jgi:hypothetical protein
MLTDWLTGWGTQSTPALPAFSLSLSLSLSDQWRGLAFELPGYARPLHRSERERGRERKREREREREKEREREREGEREREREKEREGEREREREREREGELSRLVIFYFFKYDGCLGTF